MASGNGGNSKGTAFLLWLACLFGLCGVHRFYLGRPGTGLLYLFTFGLFGVGQLIDLVRLPAMVDQENEKAAAFEALAEKRALAAMRNRRALPPPPPLPAEQPKPDDIRMKLVKAAAERGGTLSVTQGVMATGRPFEEVEAALDQMAKSGYVGIDNDPKTGAVIYTFGQL